jgi:hypothetical protein
LPEPSPDWAAITSAISAAVTTLIVGATAVFALRGLRDASLPETANSFLTRSPAPSSTAVGLGDHPGLGGSVARRRTATPTPSSYAYFERLAKKLISYERRKR